MFSKQLILGAALFGAMTLGWSSAGVAQNAQAEVRKSFQEDCQVSTGKNKGTCMRQTARTMRDLMEMALAAYKQCMRDGHEHSYCQQLRQEELEGSVVY